MGQTKSLKKYFPGIVLLAVVCLVLFWVTKNIDRVGSVLLSLMGLGVVVLVHEFGHFIVAKVRGIKI